MMLYGFFVCLDAFLFLFTILPLRAPVALLKFIMSTVLCWRQDWRLTSLQKADLCQFLIMIIVFLGLDPIDQSQLYHLVRGQSVLKLYVLFNLLQVSASSEFDFTASVAAHSMRQVFDRMCCSLGEDVFDALFGRAPVPLWREAIHFFAATAYACKCNSVSWTLSIANVASLPVTHAAVLYAMLVTINVSVNSNSHNLIVLLVSNNFVELKGTVFKRFNYQNLFQISCSGTRG